MNKKTKSGFTLIEMIVVMVIFFLMTGTLLIANSKSDSIQQVESVAQQISSQLRTLQNEALAGKRIEWPDGSGTYVTVCRFNFKSALTSYSVTYDKNCSGAQSLIGSPTNVSLNKKKVKLNVTTTIFTSPRGEVVSAVDIIVTSSKNNSVLRHVRVNQSGNVTISET